MTAETVITLIKSIPTGSDSFGTPVIEEVRKDVFAEEIGTKRSEFYSGLAAGLKPEKTYRIYEFEYSGERVVEVQLCDGAVRYLISRTYPVGDERLELICTGTAEGGGNGVTEVC